MHYLYYCNSSYQLLNVLNLHWHRQNAGFENIDRYSADLILLNSFPGADEIVEILKRDEIFKRVFLFEKKYNSGIFHAVYTLLDLFSPAFFMKDKHGINRSEMHNKYDIIAAPKYSFVVDQIWRLNKKAGLELIEEGTASYHLAIPFEPDSTKVKKARKIFKCNSFTDYQRIYLVSKDFYTGPALEKVVEIPKFDPRYFVKIKSQFSSFGKYEEKDIYWLSQFLNNVKFNLMVDDILKFLSQYKDNILFVQHPRKHLDNVYGFDETDGKQIWEIQILNMNDIDKKLFISIHSTAGFSAKMLYDKEPYLIFFYKMGERWVTETGSEFDEFLERFRKTYHNPEKIMVPETMEEFEKDVKSFISTI